jgi:hypothetical protein
VNLDAAFWPALWDAAELADTRPEVLLTVWCAESGLDPSAENAVGCIGLNQSCPKSMGGPGFPVDAATYKASPASVQMDWILPQLLDAVRANGGGFLSAARYWQANMLPATLATARAPNDTIAAAAGPYAAGYAANKDLDFNRDGRITLADLGAYLQKHYGGSSILRSAVATAYAQRPSGAPWSSPALVFSEPSRGGGGIVAGLLAAAGLGAVLLRRRP